MSLKYKRVLLKISGEVLGGPQKRGFDHSVMDALASQIKELKALDVSIGIVVGGGNFIRGRMFTKDTNIKKANADYMGMLGTVMNGIALQDYLEAHGVATRVMSAIQIREICEPYVRRRSLRHLEKDRVVIFSAGTGHPFFTTDTAASLRAIEMEADILLKATNVDGVYDSDPNINKDAKLYTSLSYMDVLNSKLSVMDSTAVSLCMENKIPISIFNLMKENNIKEVILGKKIGTIIS